MLTHFGGSFRKMESLLSKYVLEIWGEYGKHSKGLVMEYNLEATCFTWIATPEACSLQQPADAFCVKVLMNV